MPFVEFPATVATSFTELPKVGSTLETADEVIVDGGGVGVGLGVGELETAAQVGTVTVLVSKVTSPVLASNLPSTTALVPRVILVDARIVPWKLDPLPSVAELPTCQKTLHACAPFSKIISLAEADVSPEPAWKINTAFAFPAPFRVKGPLSWMVLAEL